MLRSTSFSSAVVIFGALALAACSADGDCTEATCDQYGGSASTKLESCVASGSGSSSDDFKLKDEDGNVFFTCSRAADDNDGCGVALISAKESFCQQHPASSGGTTSSHGTTGAGTTGSTTTGGSTGSSGSSSAAGTWSGTWSALGASGAMTLALTDASGAIGGTATYANSPCLSSANLTGTRSGNEITGSIEGGGADMTFSASLDASGGALSGSFQGAAGACGNISGTFSASRGAEQ